MDFLFSISICVAIIAHIAIYLWTSKRPSKSIHNRHVVITGGSSGIGLWLAIHCVKLGAHVTIIARNVQNLESALKKISLHRVNEKQMIQFVSLDLSKNYAEIEKALDELQAKVGLIYMLINSAGGAVCGRVDEMSVDDAVHMMNINYYAAYYPTRYVLTKLKDAGDGIITITGSQASLVGIYGYGSYAAAKFALRGLAETIAMEVSNTKISVTLALPADTDTPGYATENILKPEETKIISASAGLTKPEDISEKILRDSLSGTFISIYGLKSWLLTLICSGMSPWNGFLFTVFQSIVLGPLRFAAFALQWHFRSVVKRCAQQRKIAAQSGFAFSASQTSHPSISNGTNAVSKFETTQSVSLSTGSAPTFSFGASKPSIVSSSLAKPSFSFGSTKADETQKSPPTLSSSGGLTSTAPVMNSNIAFNLVSSSIPKPAQPESNKISLSLPATNTMSTTVQSAPARFSFGSPVALKNSNTSANILPTTTGSSVFAFGGNKSSTQVPESLFGSVKSLSTSVPSSGSVSNTNNNTPQLGGNSQLAFGGTNQAVATTTAAAPIFGNNISSATTNSARNQNNIKTTNNLFGATGLSATAKPFAFGNKTESPLNNSAIATTTTTPSIFGSPAVPTTAPPPFGATVPQPSSFATGNNNNTNSSFGAGQFSSTFGQPNKTVPSFGNSTNTITTTASSNMFGISSPPAFASTNNIFGSANSAQNTSAFGSANSAQNTPAFGFSNPSTTQANQNAFSFGQTQSPVVQQPVAVTTASIFGRGQTNTNTNSFVFGQSNAVPQASSNPAVGIFGAKPIESNSQTMTAPPSFGSSTNSVFNFTPKPNMFGNTNATAENKPAFSFNSPSTNATSVGAFGSAPSFGSPAPNNNTHQPFAFGAQSTQDAPKPFNFNSGPTSAPTQGASAPFSFSAPNANAFQFNAVPQQPATTNIFSIGPGTPATTKTGRPMRTATRRIK